MIARICAFTLQGLDVLPVEVEAGVYRGLPELTVVGLPDAVLRESRERVRSAVVNSGYQWPTRRMLVNLAPAHVRKEGSGLDLAVGVSLLKASGQLPGLDTEKLVFAGELSLDGRVRGTKGVLAAALAMDLWPDKVLAVPADNLEEAGRGTGRVLALTSLAQLRDAGDIARRIGEILRNPLRKGAGGTPPGAVSPSADSAASGPVWNLASVKGQNKAKRALEIAAAGGHHLLLVGPPGSGKSLLARCLQGILPPMDEEETLEVNRVYSAAGLLGPDMPWMGRRPFRSPHAGVSKAGLLGGGIPFRPGEISLAHRGVLYIDELPEMSRNCLESLRQPLEEGRIILSRAWGSVCLPARIQLAASANPCPCGYFGEYPPKCSCRDDEIRRYRNRFSGPLLDRIDMLVRVPRLDGKSLGAAGETGEDSRAVAARVAAVWQKRQERQDRQGRQERQGEKSGDLESLRGQLDPRSRKWALQIYEQYGLSARGFYRMLLLARTVADLNGEDTVDASALAEALEYRLGTADGEDRRPALAAPGYNQ